MNVYNRSDLIGEFRGCSYNLALLFIHLISERDPQGRQLKTVYQETIHTLKTKGTLAPDLLTR